MYEQPMVNDRPMAPSVSPINLNVFAMVIVNFVSGK
jgi:hypothetical protein